MKDKSTGGGGDEDSEHELGVKDVSRKGRMREGSRRYVVREASMRYVVREASMRWGAGSEHDTGVCGEKVSMRWGVKKVRMKLGMKVCLKKWVQTTLMEKRTNQPSTSLIVLFKESKNVMEILCCHALRQHCTH